MAHSTGTARVIVVPGWLCMRTAELPVQHLCDNGYDASLLQPPAWRGVEHDLERYGRNLAADIVRDGVPVDVLIGLSAGTQAAAVAASLTDTFDSASVLHAATAAALEGQPFPNLGSSALAGLAVRAAGRLPWSLLRGIYTRIGASEGIDPRRLGDVDLSAVAASFAERYPKQRYPAILIGSSNGALTHLAAAMQLP